MKTKRYIRLLLILTMMVSLSGLLCLGAGAEDLPVLQISDIPAQAAAGDAAASGFAAVPQDSHYRVGWNWYRYIDGDNSGAYELFEGQLQEGECYFLEFSIWVDAQWDGWQTADEYGDVLVVLQINGAEDQVWASVSPIEDDSYAGHGLCYYMDYDFTEKLDSVDLQGIPQVVAGGSATTETVTPAEENASYTVEEVRWSCYDPVTGLYIDIPDNTFADGGIYQLYICIRAAQGYGFSENTAVTLDGEETDAFYTYSTTIEIYQDYDLSNKIKEVHINGITAPVIGEAAITDGITVAESALCALSAQWYELDMETGEGVEVTDIFEEGGYYYLELTLDAVQGYSFDEDAVAYIDGQEEFCWVDTTQMVVSLDYDLRGGIEIVELTGTDQVQIGKPATSDGVTVPEDAPYTAQAYWMEMTAEQSDFETFEGVFEEGHIYAYCIELYPTGGNRFTEHTQVYYNGEEMAEDDCVILEDMILLTPILYTGNLQCIDTVVLQATPVSGAAPGDVDITVPAGAQYTLGEVTWTDSETLDEVTGFEAGKSYVLMAQILPAEGYYIADTIAFTVNDQMGFAAGMYVYAIGFAELTCPEPEEETTGPEEETTGPEEVITEPEEETTGPEEVITEPEEETTGPEEETTQASTEPSTDAPTEPSTEAPVQTPAETDAVETDKTGPDATGDSAMVLLLAALTVISAVALVLLTKKKAN